MLRTLSAGASFLLKVRDTRGAAAITYSPRSLHCIVLDLPEVVADDPSKICPDLRAGMTFAGDDISLNHLK